MSKQPDISNGAKLYAHDQEEQTNQTRHPSVEDNSAKTQNDTKLEPTKTEEAKIFVANPESQVGNDDEKSPEKTPQLVERKTTNIQYSELKATNQVNSQENKEKVSPSINTEPNSKSQDRAETSRIEKGKGEGKSQKTEESSCIEKDRREKKSQERKKSIEEGKGQMKSQDREESSSIEEGKGQVKSQDREESSGIEEGKGEMNSQETEEKTKEKSVKILIMNADGEKDKELESPTKRRKETIQTVVKAQMPDIILFQECKLVTRKVSKPLPFPERYVFKEHKDHKEACIVHDKNCIKVSDLPDTELDIPDEMQANSDTFSPNFTLRMYICKITEPIVFICISWHGPSNEKNENNSYRPMKLEKKIKYFEYWMEFLRKIRVKYKLPILAAGDYNVNMESIAPYVKSPFKLCPYKASQRRKGSKSGIIDYAIVTEDLNFNDVTWVNLETVKSVLNPNGILDHDPLVGILSVSGVGETGAATGAASFDEKKGSPSPIAAMNEDEELQPAISDSLIDDAASVKQDRQGSTTVEQLLTEFKELAVKPGERTNLVVSRQNVLESAFNEMSSTSFNFNAEIYVNFSGEIGQDYGGPRREFFRLALHELQNCPLFEGSEGNKLFSHNNDLVKKDQYGFAGRLVALSIAQGGPGPHFLNEGLYEIMTDTWKGSTELAANVMPEELKDMLNELQNIDSDNLRDRFLEKHGDWLANNGIPNIRSLSVANRSDISERLVKYAIYDRSSAEVAQFTSGMNDIGQLWDKVKANPALFKPLFCLQVNLTKNSFEEICEVVYSENGSGKRESEEETVHS